MIHLHLTADDAKVISEGLLRLNAEAVAGLDAEHLTPEAKRMLRQHALRLKMLRDQLQAKTEAPAKRKPGADAKAGRKIGVAVERGFPG